MAIAALIGYVSGVLLCFGWRTWLQHCRTGDAGFRRPAQASAANIGSRPSGQALVIDLPAVGKR